MYEDEDFEKSDEQFEHDKLDVMDAIDEMRRPLTDEERQEQAALSERFHDSEVGNVTISMSRHAAIYLRHLIHIGMACDRRSQYDMKILAENALMYEGVLAGVREALDQIPLLMATPEAMERVEITSDGINRQSLDLDDPAIKEMVRLSRNAYLGVQMVAFSEVGLLPERIKLELIRQEAESQAFSTARLPRAMIERSFDDFKRLYESDCERHQKVYGEDWSPSWNVRDYAQWVLTTTEGMSPKDLARFGAMFADHFAVGGDDE